jgi:hypothetical protein
MNYTVTRLDRRYAYWEEFNYMIEFHKNREWGMGTGVLDFDRARKWFNETYGWSQEVDTRREMVASKVRYEHRHTRFQLPQYRLGLEL